MKAYRQFSLKSEHRLVWSYTAALILFGIIVMVRPVFAQDDEPTRPELKIDVQKEYDENGNLITMDSIRTWNWSGKVYSMQQFDSLWKNMDDQLSDFFPPNPGHSGSSLHNFWHWNNQDSSAYSYFNELFDDEFVERFKNHSDNFHFKDIWSFMPPGFNEDILREREQFDADLEEHFRDLQDRFRKYSEEHQQLIEKYLKEPWQKEDIHPDSLPRKEFPVPEDENKSRSREI